MNKTWTFLKKNGKPIILGLLILVLGIILYYDNNDVTAYNVVEKTYEEKFDMATVPAGLIIWKHGIPGTEIAFNHADSSARYEKYNVGILTKNGKYVYKVEVPFYAIGLFTLGGTVNIRNTPNNKPPNNNNIIIPNNNYKQIKNL
jgi:hypothetical protein